ncbi:hypothetical protein KSS94_08800 [Pseudomonas fakonensis]|uniref:Uncharacterized protein n=1 Tax=Pseudomonas fakonensis TaxID=2842355 RepID=A0ABX8NA92_9PSED|nr:hypothetical protein [Pseudomonas fakonensis]QXH53197.1 hypothetical protein KSS94_08800 [Pseudomonas fakonensis]
MSNVIVKFTGAWRGYSAGEVAGFPADVAQSLIDGERAELHDQKKVAKSAAAKPKQAAKGGTQPGPAKNPDATDNPDDEKPDESGSADDDKPDESESPDDDQKP